MSDGPHYIHDCKNCIFIGSTIGGGRMTDCYAHECHDRSVTLIARFSSDGPDYYSTDLTFARPDGHSELWAARALYKTWRENEQAKQTLVEIMEDKPNEPR